MVLDKSMLIKRDRFLASFFADFESRWKRIVSLRSQYPGEGLVLAYCFTEALGYYRYGFNNSNFSSIEQFVKILYEYQDSRHFFTIPPTVVKQLPLEKNRRKIGRFIPQVVLKWLKTQYSETVGARVDDLWKVLPEPIIASMGEKSVKMRGFMYQISWAGHYYESIRTYGVHMGYFPKTTTDDQWQEISSACESILERLKEECLSEIKFPHQLSQADSLY